MMECKKALSSPEVNNDIELAKEWLRKHGSAKASSKVAGREALEGLVGIQITEDTASLVKVASETDFASRSEVFSTFVQDVADAAASTSNCNVSDIPTFMSTSKTSDGKVLNDILNDAILAIRENLAVDSISIIKASSPNSILGGYVHGKASSDVTCGSSAAIVELQVVDEQKAKDDVAQDAAKKLAMHIVAAKPQYLDPQSVPDDVLSKEKEIIKEKLKDSNKPPEILEKIINGQLRKYYESVCLTEQAHMVEEGNAKVEKVLKQLGLEIKDYKLMGMNK